MITSYVFPCVSFSNHEDGPIPMKTAQSPQLVINKVYYIIKLCKPLLSCSQAIRLLK